MSGNRLLHVTRNDPCAHRSVSFKAKWLCLDRGGDKIIFLSYKGEKLLLICSKQKLLVNPTDIMEISVLQSANVIAFILSEL